MKNREKLEEKLQETERKIGCYDKRIEHLSEEALMQVLAQVDYGTCDVQVVWNQQPYVVEIYYVDDEVDFDLLSASDYENQYGRAVGE